MKLNNIILGLFVCVGLFTACTSEEEIDGTTGGEATTFSIKIGSSDAETKSVAANYKYATDDEITVKKVTVAVFKANGTSVGELVSGPMEVMASSMTTTTSSDGKKAYEITNLVGKTGSAYILVIANSSADYSACKSYSDFAAATESVGDGKSFTSSNLVKVGLKQVNLASAASKATYEVPMNQIAARIDLKLNPVEGLTYFFNKVIVSNINTKSDVIINSSNAQDGIVESTVFDMTAPTDTFSFYTFENPVATKRIKVSFEGTLTETATNNVTTNKVYSFTFNENINHGYIYDVKGTLDAATRKMNFSWNLLAWGGSKETDVDIKQVKYLVVKDLNISMPNTTTASTIFQSSSPIISISNLTVKNGSTSSNTVSNTTINYDHNVNSGNITIISRIPINFVPDTITFTVTNNDGLTQDVTVMQYPPLYITSQSSILVPKAGNSQNNDQLYEIKTLVTDLSILSIDINDYELNEGTWYHKSGRENRVLSDVNAIKNSAVFGYPLTESGTYSGYRYIYSGYSSYSSDRYFSNVDAFTTIEGAENNTRISPDFILASQNGVNSININNYAKVNCAGYYESVKNADGSETLYGAGTWRMPTQSELMLIDILQNTTKCAVKKILEGSAYLNALPEQLEMIDPRITSTAVRCVRDIK